jgi:hypothetical protein
MKDTQNISQLLQQMRVPASAKLDGRIHREIDNAMPSPATAPADAQLTLGQIFTLILKKQSTRYTIASTLVLAVLVGLALIHSTPSAWAMEQAVEALKKYKGVQFTGYVTTDGKTVPLVLWARADTTGDSVEAGLAKSGGYTVWTKDNQTYTYDQSNQVVYIEPGITLGLDPWPGPKLFTLMSKMKNYQAFEGDDPATGRPRVVVTSSTDFMTGPESFLMEFDARSKLLVSAKTWANSRQEGMPVAAFEKVLFFEDLPDSAFDFQPPRGTLYTNAPLTIPDAGASLPALSDPNCGISAEGMTREEACQKILGQLWAAQINTNFARIRQLLPYSATWSDDLMREECNREEMVQVLKIGGIERTGNSKLGPLALVPGWIRYQGHSVVEVWMIVQFRETGHGTSCVIYGPHGYALNAKE